MILIIIIITIIIMIIIISLARTDSIGLDAYLTSSNDRFLQLVQRHEKKGLKKYRDELDLRETSPADDEAAVLQAKKIKATTKRQGQEQLQKRWEEKAMHGRYPLRIREADVDMKLTNQWLKLSGLQSETEGLIAASQDQVLLTRAYQHHIIKNGTDPHCHLAINAKKQYIILYQAAHNWQRQNISTGTIRLQPTYTGISAGNTRWTLYTSGMNTIQKQL